MRTVHMGYFNGCFAGGERWFCIGLPRPNGVHEYESFFFLEPTRFFAVVSAGGCLRVRRVVSVLL